MEPTWNIDSLKVYLEALIEANSQRITEQARSTQEALRAALAATEKATLKAETAANERFASVNEFRETLTDQQRTFIPRAEADVRLAALDEQIKAISSRLDQQDGGRRGSHEGWGWAAAAVSFIIAVVSLVARFLPH
jgi:small-conductance mechanosensitive channel